MVLGMLSAPLEKSVGLDLCPLMVGGALAGPGRLDQNVLKDDLDAFKPKPGDAQDRAGWRSSVKNS